MRLEQPRTKCRALPSASAIARASLSMGAYLEDQGGSSHIRQGTANMPGHGLEQGRGRVLAVPKTLPVPVPGDILLPGRMEGDPCGVQVHACRRVDVISSLDASNASWRSSVHMNWAEDFRRARNGAMTGAIEKANATWLTSPNQALMSVGIKSVMARRYLLHGLTSVLVIWNPANSTSSCVKQNLSGFKVIPLRAQMSSHSVAWWKASSMDVEGIVDALRLVVHFRHQAVVPCRVGIPRGNISLGGQAVPVPPPWCYERGIVAADSVRATEW